MGSVCKPNICIAQDEMKLLGAPVSTRKETGASEVVSVAGREEGATGRELINWPSSEGAWDGPIHEAVC